MTDGPKEFSDLFEALINDSISPSAGFNHEDLEIIVVLPALSIPYLQTQHKRMMRIR